MGIWWKDIGFDFYASGDSGDTAAFLHLALELIQERPGVHSIDVMIHKDPYDMDLIFQATAIDVDPEAVRKLRALYDRFEDSNVRTSLIGSEIPEGCTLLPPKPVPGGAP